jgi:hypothetical protein
MNIKVLIKASSYIEIDNGQRVQGEQIFSEAEANDLIAQGDATFVEYTDLAEVDPKPVVLSPQEIQGNIINGADTITPTDSDLIGITDVTDTNKLKKLTILDLRTKLANPDPIVMPPKVTVMEFVAESNELSNTLADWNTFFFDTETHFTSLEVVGNVVTLVDGSDLTLISDLFSPNGTGNANIVSFSSNVFTTIESGVFYGCDLLATVNFPLVTTIGIDAFSDCDLLLTANFPLAVTIGASAFKACGSLTTVNVPLVTTIGNEAFMACRAVTTFNLPLAVTFGTDVFNVLNGYGLTITFNLSPVLKTSNNGSMDANVTYLLAENGSGYTINWIYTAVTPYSTITRDFPFDVRFAKKQVGIWELPLFSCKFVCLEDGARYKVIGSNIIYFSKTDVLTNYSVSQLVLAGIQNFLSTIVNTSVSNLTVPINITKDCIANSLNLWSGTSMSTVDICYKAMMSLVNFYDAKFSSIRDNDWDSVIHAYLTLNVDPTLPSLCAVNLGQFYRVCAESFAMAKDWTPAVTFLVGTDRDTDCQLEIGNLFGGLTAAMS